MNRIYQKSFLGAKNAGFTLIELLMVVLIMGILSAVALPQYIRAVEKARAAETMPILRAIASANELYYMANGEYTSNYEDLDIELPGDKTNYVNLKRKQTQYFNYAPSGMVGGNPSLERYIALANRLPAGVSYFLYIMPGSSQIYCHDYAGDKCKWLSSDQRAANGDYIM